MPTLGEMATLIRSKNAGPFNLTFDIMFEEEENYQKVIASNVLTKEVFSSIYVIPVEEVLLVHHGGKLCAGLFHVGPGFLGALDVHGDRQHLNVLRTVFFVESLPSRQLLPASSPGRPHEQDELLAPVVREAHLPAFQRPQGEVRGFVADVYVTVHIYRHLNPPV